MALREITVTINVRSPLKQGGTEKQQNSRTNVNQSRKRDEKVDITSRKPMTSLNCNGSRRNQTTKLCQKPLK